MSEAYFDYLTSNGERYYPYTRVNGVFNVDGSPLTDWMASMNIHNHDIRYAASSHTHDTRYALLSHTHEGYALAAHNHNYAASSIAGGAANTALALDKPFVINVIGAVLGSVSISGDSDVEMELALNHNHDDNYVKLDSNNVISAKTGVDNPLTIAADGGKSKIGLSVAGSPDVAYIEYDGSAMNFGVGSESVLKYNAEGVYHNSEKLATEAFVLDNVVSGGGVDLSLLDTRYSSINHTHTISYITDMPSKMANPYPLYLNVNGAEYDYDGSSEISVINISATTVGAALVTHGHTIDNIEGLQDALDNKQPVGKYALEDHTHNQYLVSGSKVTDFGNTDTDVSHINIKSANSLMRITASDEKNGAVIVVNYGDTNVCRFIASKNTDGINVVRVYVPGYEDAELITIEGGQAESVLADGTVISAVEPKVTINAHVSVLSLTDLSASETE